MCSNISTDTMRSNRAPGSNEFMSCVRISTLRNPRARARRSMNARCELEFETPTIRAFG
jgi:hypothetical protein